MTSRKRLLSGLAVLACACCALLSAGASAASAANEGWWVLSSDAAPSNLHPGQTAFITTTAVNDGYKPIVGSSTSPIVIRDTLPEGVEVTSVTGEAGPFKELPKLHRKLNKLPCKTEGRVLSCPWEGAVPPAESIRLLAHVTVSSSLANGSTAVNTAEVTGGSARTVGPIRRSIEVNSAPTKFGVEHYEVRPENDEGGLEPQAGAHPFQLTTVFDANEVLKEIEPQGKPVLLPNAPALVKDLHFVEPAGLIGKAAHMPRCSGADFAALVEGGGNECPENTAIGYSYTTAIIPFFVGYLVGSVPIFNLTPEEGEPARFGFTIHNVPVVLTTHVRSGKDYAVEVTVHDTSESAIVLTSQVTLWGVPYDHRHNEARGWECIQEGSWIEGGKPCRSSLELEEEENPTLAEENAQLRKEGKQPKEAPPEAFLSMPTTCEGDPVSTITGEAWNGEGNFGLGEGEPYVFSFRNFFREQLGRETGFTGCEKLKFEPSISVRPDKPQAATPSGYTVNVELPQAGTLSGKEGELDEADVRATTLTLPAGVYASAGASQGLGTCTTADVGFEGAEPPGSELEPLLLNDAFNEAPVSKGEGGECSEKAKIGSVEVETPVLEEKLTGSVYLGRENTNPFTGQLVLFIVAESPFSHVIVKLAGAVTIDHQTGQLTSVFENTPPVPFSKLTLHLYDGPRASQSTPEKCSSTNESVAQFVGSNSEPSKAVTREARSNFAVTTGPGGGPCNPAFQPGFEAKAESSQAGAFSPFRVHIVRPDGENQLRSLSVTEPPGAAAMLASVTPCPTAIAEQIAPETLPPVSQQSHAECPASSLVGESTAVAGLGSATYGGGAARVSLPGKVYLTGPYHGAPFGLLDVTDAEPPYTGPFNLGHIGVMSRITVNETTAQATVTSNPLPQYDEGVPASISELTVNVNRPGFTFNPTNCSGDLPVKAQMTGWGAPGTPEGSWASESPFYVTGCSSLSFKPKIEVSVESNVSRVEGTGMRIKITANKGDANIGKTKLEFPKVIPSRLPTLHEACLDSVFAANPAGCGERSIIGTAVARTPVLKSPLVGPVYLVSHGGAAFPDAEIVLQGEGIRLLLDGQTEISESGANKGVTISSFESVPDAPVESFEVDLPRKAYSAFSGYGNLCEEKPIMPTLFTGQNGATESEDLAIDVTGCGKTEVKHSSTENELAKLLKKCKKAKSSNLRAKCDATAHKLYSAVQTCKKKDKKSKSKMAKCEAAARKKYVLKLK